MEAFIHLFFNVENTWLEGLLTLVLGPDITYFVNATKNGITQN